MTHYLYDIFKHWGTNIFVYSDPHFSDLDSYKFRFPTTFQEGTEFMHDSIVNLLDEMQIKNINSVAGKASTLIILGDIGNIECVKKLKAKYKILILGNHDKGVSNYKRDYGSVHTETVVLKDYIVYGTDPGMSEDAYEYRDVIDRPDNNLFDEIYEGPLMINDKCILSHEPVFAGVSYFYNIHGHVHRADYKGDEHHLNCCAEAIDYKPINLLKIFKNGKLKHIDSIHRMTIDNATARKKLYNNK